MPRSPEGDTSGRLQSVKSRRRGLRVNWPLQGSLSLGHPDHLGGICHVIVLNDLPCRIELPEVTVVGEGVALALSCGVERDEREDLVTAVEDCMRFKAGDQSAVLGHFDEHVSTKGLVDSLRELVPGAGIEPTRPFRDPGF